MLRDRSHDTGKLLQDGSRYPARLRSSGAHPPPCPAPRLLPGGLPPPCGPSSSPLPPSPLQSAARPFGRTGSLRTRRLEGRRRRGPTRGTLDPVQGRGPTGQGAGRLGIGLPLPWGAPGPPPAFAGSFVLFSSNYLSQQRVGEGPKKGLPLPEGFTISIRGALLGERGGNTPAFLPPYLFLFSLLLPVLLDTTPPPLLFPPPTWEFAVWTRSEHSKLSPSKLRSGVEPPPRAGRSAGIVAASLSYLALQRSRVL